ncbi:hypothetical protein [Plebeiibacterium marinum]|uniref:Outer membrane protein beta-barrel domain-containing protein n=1 Tax=Plebeiibacterium marinum TaxID=2992111 RepID=A0AAE3SJZ6_9BACT|nr:hypothetical protein [Plebeiobacterium marinum]MCW3805973.1 hypothetical protein [Plebeiobacterium marinum]
MENNIDRLFREGLSNHSETPPTHVWDAINSQLGKERKRKRILVIWQGTAAAAIIGLIFLATLFFNQRISNTQKTNYTADNSSITETTVKQNTQVISSIENHIDSDRQEEAGTNYEKTLSKNYQGPVMEKSELNKNNTHFASLNKKNTIVLNKNKHPKYSKLDNYKTGALPTEEINASVVFFVLNKDFETNQLTNLVFSETDTKEKNRKQLFSEISIGGKIAPSYSYRNSDKNYANKESGITSLTGGINLDFKTSKRLRIETGLMYTQVGQKFSNSSIVFNNSLSYDAIADYGERVTSGNNELQNSLGTIQKRSSGNVYADSPSPGVISEKTDYISSLTSTSSYEVDVQQELDYIEIPFILKYDLIKRKIAVSLNGGFSTNLLVGNNAYRINNNSKSKIGSMENINSVGYSASFGFGLRTPLNSSFDFNVEPRLKYFINSITNATGYDYKPYSFGVLFGVNYKF